MATGYTPIYRIFRDGIDVTSNFNDRATSITVELSSGGEAGDICEITLDDRDWAISYPSVGDQIDVYLGYEEVGLANMGRFVLDQVKFSGPPRSIVLHANSTGMASAITVPALQAHLDGTLGSVLSTLGEMTGLDVKVHPDLAEKVLPALLQSVPPLHLVDQLARNFGAIAKISDQTLAFVPRDQGISVSGNVAPIFGLLPEHFGTWEAIYNDRSDYAAAKAAWWDRDENVRRWVRQGRLASTMPSLAEDREYMIERLYASESEAKAAALSAMQQMIRNAGTLYATLAKGDPWIRDQQRLSVRGMREGINGSYVIATATHSYSKDIGLSTSIHATATGMDEDFEALYPEADDDFILPLPGELFGELLKGPGGRLAGPI